MKNTMDVEYCYVDEYKMFVFYSAPSCALSATGKTSSLQTQLCTREKSAKSKFTSESKYTAKRVDEDTTLQTTK